jgi:TPR repeat protein
LNSAGPQSEGDLAVTHALRLIVLAVVLALSGGAAPAGPVEDARVAYGKGDYASALRHAKPSAEQGNAEAQMLLGTMYYNGHGVEKKRDEASNWARRAAEQGNARAQVLTGMLIIERTPPPTRAGLMDAQMWLSLAAKQGISEASIAVAKIDPILTPEQIAEVKRRVAEWKPVKSAASSGNPGTAPARKSLGEMVLESEKAVKFRTNPAMTAALDASAKRDYATALELMRPVAEKGDRDAQVFVADIYWRGEGVRQDHAEALKWYRRAADQGDRDGLFFLGVMHARGQGTSKDPVTALMFFNLSVAQGKAPNTRARMQLLREMTPAQIAKAEKRAGEWKPGKH